MHTGRGLLYLTLKSGRDLHKRDLFGKQQPYCQVDVGKVRAKARTCKDGGQNPDWNETLFFQLSDETEVLVTLFAEHQLSKDASIGTAVIPLSRVRSTGREELSVPVIRKNKRAGSINVLLEFKGQPLTSFGQLPGDAAAASLWNQSASQRAPAYSTPGTSQPAGALRVASMPVLLMQQQPQQPNSGYLQQAASLGSTGAASLDSVVQLQRSASLAKQQQSVLAQQQQLQQQQQQLHQLQQQLQQQQQQQQQLQQPASADTPAPQQQQQQLVVQQQLQHLQLLQQQLASNLPRDLQQQQQQNLLMQQQLLGQLASAVHSLPHVKEPAVQQPPGAAAAGGGGADAEGAVPLAPRRTAADLFVDQGAAAAARRTAADLFQPSEEGSRLLPVGSSCSLQQELDGLDVDDALLSSGTSAPFSFDMTRLQAIIDKVYPPLHAQQQAGGLAAGSSGSGTTPPSHGAFVAALIAAEAGVASEGTVPGSCFGFGGAAGLLAAEAALAGDDGPPAKPAAGLPGTDEAAGLGQPAAGDSLARPAAQSMPPPPAAAAAAAGAGAAADGSAVSGEGELQRLRAAYAHLSRLLELAGGSGAGGGVPASAPARPRSAGAGTALYPLVVIERVVGEVTREFDAQLLAAEAQRVQLAARLQEQEEQLQRLRVKLAACEQELQQARSQFAAAPHTALK